MNRLAIEEWVRRYFLNFVQAQVVVALVSIPILVGWGVPLSVMTLVGNLIFAPILAVFLVLSSLIFFTELLMIPNSILIRLLDLVNQGWIQVLNFGRKEWFWGFCKPNVLILLLMMTSIFLYLVLIKSRLRTLCLALVILFFIFNFISVFFVCEEQRLVFKDGKLVVKIDNEKKVSLIDNGFFNQKASLDKFIEYDIKRCLMKNTGRYLIDYLHLLRPSFRSFKAANELCLRLNVKNVILPLFNKKLNGVAWREFFKLKSLLNERNINFVRMGSDQILLSKIHLSNDETGF